MDIPRGEAARSARYQESANAVRGGGPHYGDVGDRPVGDPHFGAREYPVAAVQNRAGFHAGRVAAVIGLGEAEAADRLARSHPWQPLARLVLRSVLPDREHRRLALPRLRTSLP